MIPSRSHMTVEEAAEYLRVSRRTIRRYIADGRLPDIKPRGRRLLPMADVLQFARAP